MWPGASPSAVVNGAAGMIMAGLLVAALYAGRDLLIPLAIAGMLSFVLAPLVRRLVGWGLPHGASVAFVVVVLLGLLFAGATVTGREVTQLLEDLPNHETNLRDKARFVHLELGGSGIWQRAAATIRNIEQEVRDPQTANQPLKIEVAQGSDWLTLFEYTRSSVPSIVTAGLALLLTVFMLLQYQDLRDRAVRLMGTAEIGRSTQVFNEAGDDLAHFLLLQSCLNAAFGAIIAIALWAIGIPSPVLWGAIAAVMRFVPYIGVFVAAAFPMAIAAMIDPGWWMLIETAAVFLIGEPLVGQIVEPLLFGSQTRLSPLAVLIGTMFWTLVWGPVGLILAVPLTVAIAVMGQHVPHLEFLRVLLGNEPALKPQEQLYHQLLSGEASQAAKEADRRIADQTFQAYLDEVAVPSLCVASDDQKRGVLGREQIAELKDTIAEYIGLVKESLDFEREQRAAAAKPDAARRTVNALVLAGRGNLDLAAAELVADAIRLDLGIAAVCPSLGGLTGISAAAEAAPDAHPDIVALVSVGAVTAAQLELLRRRVSRTFPRSQLIIGYWGERDVPPPGDAPGAEAIRHVDSAAALIDLIGRIADERLRADSEPRSVAPADAEFSSSPRHSAPAPAR
jgi:predicted PurR-regulated permease PerM